MPTLRDVTDTILRPDGSPAANELVSFYLQKGAFTVDETFPPARVDTTTNEAGGYTKSLWVNTEGLVPSKWRAVYPNAETILFDLPPGDGPITMAELRAQEAWNWHVDPVPDAIALERARLADTTAPELGAGLIGYIPTATSGSGRTVQSKLNDWWSVYDVIPVVEHEAIFAGESDYDATDDILEALAYGADTGRITRAEGGYLNVNDTIPVLTNIDFTNATLRTTDPDLIVLQVGDDATGVQGLHLVLPDVEMIGHVTAEFNGGVADWGTGIGVRLVNVQQSVIDVGAIAYFNTGLDVTAVGRGTAYNKINGRHLRNNKRNLRIGPDISDPTSYTNQMTINIERYSMESGERGGSALFPQLASPIGSRHILIDQGGNHPVNRIVINEPSLEGNSPEFHVEMKGTLYCPIMFGRYEVNAVNGETATPRIYYSSYSYAATTRVAESNTVFYGYNAHSIIFTEDAGCARNHLYTRQRILIFGQGGNEPVMTLSTTSGSGDAPVLGQTISEQISDTPSNKLAWSFSQLYVRFRKYTDAALAWRIRIRNAESMIEYSADGDGVPSRQDDYRRSRIHAPGGTVGNLVLGNQTSSNYPTILVTGATDDFEDDVRVSQNVAIGAKATKFKETDDAGYRIWVDTAHSRILLSNGQGDRYLVTPTSPPWTFTWNGETTLPIAAGVDSGYVEEHIAALSNVGEGNVSVSGPNGGPFDVYFINELSPQFIPTPTATGATVESVSTWIGLDNEDLNNGLIRITSNLHLTGDTIRVATDHTPANASAPGVKGDVRFDANYIYRCVATNTWKRAALSSW